MIRFFNINQESLETLVLSLYQSKTILRFTIILYYLSVFKIDDISLLLLIIKTRFFGVHFCKFCKDKTIFDYDRELVRNIKCT